jgi:hypothetical protein
MALASRSQEARGPIGGFSHVEVTDKLGGESLCRGAAIAGEIRVADRGYAKAPDLRAFLDGNRQADYIIRIGDLITDTDRMMRRLMEPPRSRTARGIAIIQSSRLTWRLWGDALRCLINQ